MPTALMWTGAWPAGLGIAEGLGASMTSYVCIRLQLLVDMPVATAAGQAGSQQHRFRTANARPSVFQRLRPSCRGSACIASLTLTADLRCSSLREMQFGSSVLRLIIQGPRVRCHFTAVRS